MNTPEYIYRASWLNVNCTDMEDWIVSYSESKEVAIGMVMYKCEGYKRQPSVDEIIIDRYQKETQTN